MHKEHTYASLSDFYTDLWGYLNTFFNDTRWLDAHPNGTSPTDRFSLLEKSFADLQAERLSVAERRRADQDFEAARHLREEFATLMTRPRAKDDAAYSRWLKEAEQLRSHAQELGLRYADRTAK
ncbi:MAG: hypothetical protein JNM70_11730 [Anaerolineae bacterium]|nr:hypothetical protein [Anaerolineae bacterium]